MKPEMDQRVKKILGEAARYAAGGALRDAEALYRRAVSEFPEDGEAVHAFGIYQFHQGQMETASQQVARAVLLDPQNSVYQRDLAEISRRLGRLDQALACSLAATRLAPREVDGFYNLGLIYADQGDSKNAARSYRRALKLLPTHGPSWNNLGSALERQGDLKGAQEAYQRACKLNPQHAEAHNNLGALMVAKGRLDEARESFALALAARPTLAEAHFNLSTLKTYTPDDKHVADLLAIAPQRTKLAPDVQVQYAFALAKALDDIGRYDEAFEAYAEGNRVQAHLKPYDDMGAEKVFKGVIETFDEAFFQKRATWQGVSDRRTPIFIVGMPRSGTSLLEQILATHPAVYGAGELLDFSQCIEQLTSNAGGFAAGAGSLDSGALQELGRSYLDRVWAHSPNSVFITDKMPANFYYLGLIRLALPGAKIIHAMRDPMDSCFSCFTRHFTDDMGFTYDLNTLGRYFSRYSRLMQHWRQVLPADAFLDLSYESLVGNLETEARRVMQFIGLPWDPACLDFHRNSRVVATASMAQVRKPLYSSSVGRWKHFARHLPVLWRHVAPYRANDDLTPELVAALKGDGVSKAPVRSVRTADSWHQEGYERYRQGLLHQAIECYDRALQIKPGFDVAFNSKGFVLQELGRLEEAIACLEECVRLAPSNAIGRLNLAMAQLKAGRWQEGWDNYEARWTGSAESLQGTINRAVSTLPQWIGESDTSQLSLLVITEQGFGDIFQFGRYLTLAAQRFKRVGFACSLPTLRLMEHSLGSQVAMFTRMPPDLGDWDLQCPLMSLPRAFGTRIDSVPPATKAYLHVPDPAALFWKQRIERLAKRPLRIGIAWAGRKTHQHDARRSIDFHLLAPLLNDQRIAWISLQKWAPEDLRPAIPAGVEWHDWTEEFTDFADSAALITNLDLVISVDSAMVHLAGGLLKPTWMLNRYDGEWRWLQHATTSPWYPLLRIFNQPTAGDWQAVIEQVRLALLELPVRSSSAPAATALPARSDVQRESSLDIKQALDAAARLHSAGQLGEAEHLLRRVLQIDANNAHALHMLGLLAHQVGRATLARELIGKAIEQEPGSALFYCNLIEVLRQDGRPLEAIEAGRRAVVLAPMMVAAHINLGIALYDAGLLDEAEACHKKALEIEPGALQSLNNLGSIARQRGDLTEAANWYRRAIAIQPDYLEALSNLGAALFEDNRPEEAIPHLEHALQIQPDYAEALCNLGLAHLAADRVRQAEGLLRRSLQLRADNVEALTGLAMTQYMQERRKETEQLLRQALRLKPDSKEANIQLGALLTQFGRAEDAERCYRTVLEVDPEDAEAMVGIGALRMEEGSFAEADRLFRQALTIEPLDVNVCFHLAQAGKVLPGDEVVASLAAIEGVEKFNVGKRVSFHYAYGKVLDDLGQYEPSFEHYIKGASLKRSQLEYDSASDSFRALRIAEIVNQDFLAKNASTDNPSHAPIFILGMPRSGTTLTEQIIASHSAVHGAGELETLMEVVQQAHIALPNRPFYPENLTGTDRSTMAAWGQAYLAGVPEAAHQKARFTDKMPANYYALGLITLMLPNAKIIHVKRDAIDTCVSCYTRLFGWAQAATYDLAELGRHYVAYAKLMEHWRQVLPGRFLEVQYEDIVTDMEGQARRLIAHCGLDWEDACLSFHKTKRPVRTASLAQVRQPIYKGSVQRWRRVERFLDPLIEALGDYAQTG